MLHALALLFALGAIALLAAAIVGMIQKRMSDRTGWYVRALALGLFIVAVVLNVISRS
jgi:hypothetical protein